MGTRILQVSASHHHSLLVSDSGAVLAQSAWAWRQNRANAAHGGAGFCWPSCDRGERGIRAQRGGGRSRRAVGRGDVADGVHKCRGQIEEDESHKIRQPKQVATLASQRVRHVSASNEHTLAVTASGRLYGWGLADMGALGIGEHFCEHGEWTPIRVWALEGTPVRQAQWLATAWCSPRRAKCTRWANGNGSRSLTTCLDSLNSMTSRSSGCRRS